MTYHPELEAQPMWQSIADFLGARLFGWSFDYSATLVFPGGEHLQLRRESRDALLRLMKVEQADG